MKKRAVYVGMNFILGITVLCGCGQRATEPRLLKEWVREERVSENEVQKVDRGNRVALITGLGGVEDEGFNQSAWEGLQALEQSWEIRTSYIDSESEEDFYANFEELADEGCGLCWGIGFGCADALLQIAQDRPGTHFAIVDSSFENTPENISDVV